MSIIKRITIQQYAYRLENFGPNMATFTAGVAMDCTKFVVTIETDDGLSGTYAPH